MNDEPHNFLLGLALTVLAINVMFGGDRDDDWRLNELLRRNREVLRDELRAVMVAHCDLLHQPPRVVITYPDPLPDSDELARAAELLKSI